MNHTTERDRLEADAEAMRARLAQRIETLERLPLLAKVDAAVAAEILPKEVKEAKEALKEVPVTPLPPPASEDPDAPREKIEAEAEVRRVRLARGLEALSRRWHHAFHIKHQLARHPISSVVFGAGALLAVAGGTGMVLYKVQKRKLRRPIERLRALAKLWYYPEEFARSGHPSLGVELGRGVLVSVTAFLATQLAKQTLKKLLPELWEAPPTSPKR